MNPSSIIKKPIFLLWIFVAYVSGVAIPVSTVPDALANTAPRTEVYRYIIDCSNFPAEAVAKRRFYIATPKAEIGEIEIIKVTIRKTSDIVEQNGDAYIAHTYELPDWNMWSFIGLAAVAPERLAGASGILNQGLFRFPQFSSGTNVTNKQIAFAVSPWQAFGSTPISGAGVLQPLPIAGTYEVVIVVSNKNSSAPALADYIY